MGLPSKMKKKKADKKKKARPSPYKYRSSNERMFEKSLMMKRLGGLIEQNRLIDIRRERLDVEDIFKKLQIQYKGDKDLPVVNKLYNQAKQRLNAQEDRLMKDYNWRMSKTTKIRPDLTAYSNSGFILR